MSRKDDLIWDIAMCKAYLKHINTPEFLDMIERSIEKLEKELEGIKDED